MAGEPLNSGAACGPLEAQVRTQPRGFMCWPRIYEFDGWLFEYGPIGVWPLKRNGEPRARAGRRFYQMLDRFTALSEDERTKCREGGGCVAF